ncbi:MAG: dTDP-4-dehydrorhamnose 3 5-epimerase-like protein, dTDP-4-dehydrorhamnose 3,5-epimerase [Candidatus Gottesmanbacteria bacterium GW2011_GWA2_43_14]|uniref:dTDP-4-dehydrorhamnose 3 5-epimerase-like protein, dTDP-4-dehydrorhamnose 3,5-epimerase n=1 Tax=Candidatus Gottesmanbacteria bacterium GW2011_GWA2_43_14 TaxID=1618443 RepID=A0A0G1DLE9_9BACT|nr:MAG: dTDP-4-dehydrorhamnose 3 5-epimerase-like protein, dTDP-4-dehydrorhamnose 3,5-epimerase [Candidatus Gottesmanbacteria bacterium GW2011_GWA2_43_14]
MKTNLSVNKEKLIDGVQIKEPVRHKDERGYFEELIRVTDHFFSEGFGQVSHALMYSGVIKAWHIHKTQIDWWYISRGDVKTALFDLRENSPTEGLLNEFFMGEHSGNIVLKIPAGVAHGLKVLGGEAEIFYVTSGVYNPQEEGRLPHDDPKIGYDWLKGPEIK